MLRLHDKKIQFQIDEVETFYKSYTRERKFNLFILLYLLNTMEQVRKYEIKLLRYFVKAEPKIVRNCHMLNRLHFECCTTDRHSINQ